MPIAQAARDAVSRGLFAAEHIERAPQAWGAEAVGERFDRQYREMRAILNQAKQNQVFIAIQLGERVPAKITLWPDNWLRVRHMEDSRAPITHRRAPSRLIVAHRIGPIKQRAGKAGIVAVHQFMSR